MNNTNTNFSFMGVGKKYYGRFKFDKISQSYITTLWFVFIFIPIYPYGSFKIRETKKSYNPSLNITRITTNYEIIEELPRQWSQIIKTYIIGIAYALILIFWFYFLFSI